MHYILDIEARNRVKCAVSGGHSLRVEADDTGLRFVPTGFMMIVK